MMDGFTGFPPQGLAFLKGLAENNHQSFFSAHRGEYEEGLLEPAKALVLALGTELQRRFSQDLRAEPKVGKSLFRINRDLRFSKDKTPYNPWLDVVFWEGGEDARTCPGFILRVAPDHVVLGAGVFSFPPEQHRRFLDATLDEEQGGLLADILRALQISSPPVKLTQPTRGRVPRGLPRDHPRSDLLRLERLHATVQEGIPEEIHRQEFVRWCADRYGRFLPLHQWLVAHLTAASP